MFASIPAAFLIQPAHAATGTVCLADPTTGASTTPPCPTAPAVFSGPVGQEIRVGVFIQGSDSYSGFDVSLLSNTSFLVPVGVDLTGTVLPGTPTILVECIQGILIQGSVCGSTDNSTTLHLGATGSLGQTTSSAGLLFTAIYNITGTTATGGIPLAFVVGCSGSSVSGGVCVTVAGGNNVANSETAQASQFDNSGASTMPFVSVSSSPGVLGPVFPTVTATAIINASAVNGYPGFFTSADSVRFTVSAPSGVIFTITGTNPCTTGGTFCKVNVTLSAPAAGNYTVLVHGTYPTAEASGSETLVSTATVILDVTDFAFSINPTTVDFVLGSTGDTTLTLASLNGFSGTVALTNSTANGALITSFNPGPVTLSPGQIVNSNVTFSGPSSTGTFHFTIKLTSGTRVRFTPTLTVAVIGSSADTTTTAVSCAPGRVIVGKGTQGTCTATVTDHGSGAVNMIGNLYFASNGPGTFSPVSQSCMLPSGSTTSGSCSVLYSPSVAGTQMIVASFGGDPDHGSSQGTSSLAAVDPTKTTMVCTPNPVDETTPTSCKVVVGDIVAPGPESPIGQSPSTPTGSVTVSTNSTGTFSPLSGVCTLSPDVAVVNATCSVTYTPFAAGRHLLTATYSGDTGHNSTIGLVGLFAINNKISLACSPNRLTANGTTTSCEATVVDVTSAPVTPTGTVLFTSNATSTFNPSSATCTLSPGVPTANATCSIIYIPGVGGNNTITGRYSGDAIHSSTTNSTTIIVAGFILKATPPSVTALVGALGNTTITARALNGFTGTVTLSATPPSGLTCASPSPGTILLGSLQNSTLSCHSSNPTSYTVTVSGVSGSGLVSDSITVRYSLTQFQLLKSTANVRVAQGTSDSSAKVFVASVNSFTGTVRLKISLASSLPASVTPTVSPVSHNVTLTANANVTVLLTFTVGPNDVPGIYLVTVNGTSGTMSDQQTLDLTVPPPDFAISAPTAANVLLPGQSGSTTINVTAVDGYNGTVAFAYSPSPSGLTCSFSRNSVILLPTKQNSTVISCSGSPNLYAVTVTGTPTETYTTTAHTAIPVFSVVDFTIVSTPTGISINTGQTGHAQINVTYTKGYTGNVALTASSSSTALTATIPSSVQAPNVVTLSVVSSTAGTYTVVVNATAGTLTHSVTITVTVLANAGLDPLVLYSGIGVAIVAIAAVLILLLRRRPANKPKK